MSEQTSPTKLNENFNNSTELTTTGQQRSEESSEMPSLNSNSRKLPEDYQKMSDNSSIQYEFFSGSTRTWQSTESSTCRYISDSTARGCPHAIGVYRARREVTTADRATQGPSKQQSAYQNLYKRPQPQTFDSAVCATCGRAGHHRNACKYFMNTMCNKTQFDWADSPIGEAWQREGYDKFTIGVRLRNYPVATNAQQKMPANFVYPTEEDNIGQDLPGKFQKTAHSSPPKGNGGYVYNKLTHKKSKDRKKKIKCKSMTTYVMASIFTNTDDYVSVRPTQTTTTVDSSRRSPQEAAQIAEVNLVLTNTTQPKDPNTDRARANKVKTVEATALLDSRLTLIPLSNAKIPLASHLNSCTSCIADE